MIYAVNFKIIQSTFSYQKVEPFKTAIAVGTCQNVWNNRSLVLYTLYDETEKVLVLFVYLQTAVHQYCLQWN